jgi:hypothetical protein
MLDDRTAMLSCNGRLLRLSGGEGLGAQVLSALRSPADYVATDSESKEIHQMLEALGLTRPVEAAPPRHRLQIVHGSAHSAAEVDPASMLSGLGYTVCSDEAWPAGLDLADAGDGEDPVVVALGCTDWELYELNRRMLAGKRKWMFCSFDGAKFTISPLLQHAATPCFACLRLRRLGSLLSLEPNALFEACSQAGAPDYFSPYAPPSWALHMAMAGVARALEDTHDFMVVDCRTAASTTLGVMEVHDCMECGE